MGSLSSMIILLNANAEHYPFIWEFAKEVNWSTEVFPAYTGSKIEVNGWVLDGNVLVDYVKFSSSISLRPVRVSILSKGGPMHTSMRTLQLTHSTIGSESIATVP